MSGLQDYVTQRLAGERQILLMTHLIVGYPSLDANRAMLSIMAANDVDLIELQMPLVTAQGAPATGTEEPAPERQSFIDAVAACNTMMTRTFMALGGEERVTVNVRRSARGPIAFPEAVLLAYLRRFRILPHSILKYSDFGEIRSTLPERPNRF